MPQIMQANVFYVCSIDNNIALSQIKQTIKSTGHRTFSCPRSPNDANLFIRVCVEIY